MYDIMLQLPAGWYVVGSRPTTAWPYEETVRVSGPHAERPPEPANELLKVRYWDEKCFRKGPE